jgi:hypothetical protein
MKTACVLFLTVALAGCAGQSTKPLATAHQQIEAACVGISASYALAATANDAHRLSAAQQAQFKKASSITDKVCLNIPYSWADVPANFTDQANILQALGAKP